LSFAEIFGIRKRESRGVLRGVICLVLRLSISVEHRIVTDTQTDRIDYGIYRASMASRGNKMTRNNTENKYVRQGNRTKSLSALK